MNFPCLFRRTGLALVKNSPKILTGLGVVGVIGTTMFAIKDSPRAALIMDDLYEEYADKFDRKEVNSPKIPKVVIVKKVLPVYLPTIAMGMVTIGCILGASAMNSRRNAVLTGLYMASETALNEYRDKVVRVMGEKKDRQVKDEIAKDQVDRIPVTKSQVIITGKGETLCLDSLSGRYFKTDIESLRKSQNEINRRIISDMWITLNEVYDEIGLEAVDLGEDVGWNSDRLLEFDFSSQIAENDQPCLVLGYSSRPRNIKY